MVEVYESTVTLREIARSDLDAIRVFSSDPAVYEFVAFGPFDLEQTRRNLDRMIASQHEDPRKHFYLGVVSREISEVVGVVTLEVASEHHRVGNIGIILQRRCWGKGYAAEACRGMLQFALRELKMNRIAATVAAGNQRSLRLFKKLGFVEEGTMRQVLQIRNTFVDAVLLSFLQRDFVEEMQRSSR